MTRTTLILFACGILLWTCVCQLNHSLTPLHISVFAGGLLVAYPALRAGFREGVWCSVLLGLLVDSSSAVFFGFHAIVFTLVHVILFNVRSRFPREETVFSVFVALFANAVLYLTVTATLIHRTPDPWAMLPRYFYDLLASEILILVVAPWFFALQERSLELGGVPLRRGQRGLT